MPAKAQSERLAFSLRALGVDDAPAVCRLRGRPRVIRGTLRPPFPSRDRVRGFLGSLPPTDHLIGAFLDGEGGLRRQPAGDALYRKHGFEVEGQLRHHAGASCR